MQSLVFTAVVCLLWQHFGRIHGWQFRPSQFFSFVAGYAEVFWRYVGYGLVRVAGFYHYLYFYAQEIATSIQELLLPVNKILASPMYMIWGALESAAAYTKPELIWVGLVIISGAAVALLVYWFPVLATPEFYVYFKGYMACIVAVMSLSILYYYWQDIFNWMDNQNESARVDLIARNAAIMRELRRDGFQPYYN